MEPTFTEPIDNYMLKKPMPNIHSKRSETIDTGTLPSNTNYIKTTNDSPNVMSYRQGRRLR